MVRFKIAAVGAVTAAVRDSLFDYCKDFTDAANHHWPCTLGLPSGNWLRNET
jgi:hypothetical protein